MNYCNCPNCRTDNCPNAESYATKAEHENDTFVTGDIIRLRKVEAAQREEIVQNQGEWATLMASVQEDFANEKADRGRGRVTLVLTLLGQLRYQRDTQGEEIEKLRAALELVETHFSRNHKSDNFQGDDEHEAWTAVRSALTKPQPSQQIPAKLFRGQYWKPISNGGLASEPHDIYTEGSSSEFLDVQLDQATAVKICSAHNMSLKLLTKHQPSQT